MKIACFLMLLIVMQNNVDSNDPTMENLIFPENSKFHHSTEIYDFNNDVPEETDQTTENIIKWIQFAMTVVGFIGKCVLI